jgi:flagellar motor protein MotB
VQPKKKPSRFHRIDRDMPKYHLEDDSGHLWAVSYADFLMVLLSFFILFFSVKPVDKDTLINVISRVRERGLGVGEGLGFPQKQKTVNGSLAPSPAQIVENIKSNLKGIDFKINDKTKSVTFMLADDIYKQGRILPSVEGQNALKELIELLKPYQESLDIVFVGHTDSDPVKHAKVLGIENNFDLSALRAAAAVRFALSEGLLKEHLFIHGSADNTRSSKSLSIIAKPTGGGSI